VHVVIHGDSKFDPGNDKVAFERLQSVTMHFREAREYLLARFQQMNLNLTTIGITDFALN
jgi:hypothetical protein